MLKELQKMNINHCDLYMMCIGLVVGILENTAVICFNERAEDMLAHGVTPDINGMPNIHLLRKIKTLKKIAASTDSIISLRNALVHRAFDFKYISAVLNENPLELNDFISYIDIAARYSGFSTDFETIKYACSYIFYVYERCISVDL